MKRFALFSGEVYYPRGGWSDFFASFDTKEEALACAATQRADWWQIVDLQEGNMVECGSRNG